MAFDRGIDAAIVGAVSIVLWTMILLRLFAGRRHAPEETPSVVAPHANTVLRFVSLSLAVYYLVYVVWLIRPGASGPYLFDPAPWSAVIGLVLAAASLALIGWTFVVFGSWRLLAQIDEDHVLVTDGPFGLMRHPIYTGIVGAYISTLFIVPTVGFLIAVLLIAISHDVRARVEEGVLVAAFGDRYTSYLDHTKRFVPGVY